MVKVLLEAGAKMFKVEEWGLPTEAAKGLVGKEDGAAKVGLIEHWLEEGGPPRDVDLPVFVDEKKKKKKEETSQASSRTTGSWHGRARRTRLGEL